MTLVDDWPDRHRGPPGPPKVETGGLTKARIVAQRHRAGESIAELAEDYRVDLEHIEDAIRCETVKAA